MRCRPAQLVSSLTFRERRDKSLFGGTNPVSFDERIRGDATQDDLDRLALRAFKGLVVERAALVESGHLMRGVGVLLRCRPDHVEEELRLDRLQPAGGNPAP